MIWGLALYAALVLALLAAELRQDRRAQILFKPLAALGFVLLALSVGALDSLYGQIILAGLIACAIGDVLLLPRENETIFKAGMLAFAIGHFCYLSAFITQQTDAITALTVPIAIIAIFGGGGFFLWLKPKLPKGMLIPVSIYTAIIMLMVMRSFDMPMHGAFIYAPIAAVMFAVSDMFVARDRFVTREPKNALAITPLYFGAQALFALSVQM